MSTLEAAGGNDLRKAIYSIVGSAQAADDVLQQAYLKFLQQKRADIESPGGWFRRAAMHLAIDHARKTKRDQRFVSQSEVSEGAISASSVDEELAWREKELAWRNFDQRCAVVLRTLSTEQRELVVLHYEAGMSIKAIAEQWSTTEAAIQQRLSRVLRRFREAMRRGRIQWADLE